MAWMQFENFFVAVGFVTVLVATMRSYCFVVLVAKVDLHLVPTDNINKLEEQKRPTIPKRSLKKTLVADSFEIQKKLSIHSLDLERQ